MRPLSTGYVEAKSPDPRQAPAINPRYLSEETDRRAVIGGLRLGGGGVAGPRRPPRTPPGGVGRRCGVGAGPQGRGGGGGCWRGGAGQPRNGGGARPAAPCPLGGLPRN